MNVLPGPDPGVWGDQGAPRGPEGRDAKTHETCGPLDKRSHLWPFYPVKLLRVGVAPPILKIYPPTTLVRP